MNFCQTLQVRREAFTDRLWPTFPSRGDVFLEPLTVCVLAFVRCTSQAPEVSCTAQQLWGFRKINLPLSLIGILLFSLHNLLFNQQPITSTWKLLYVTGNGGVPVPLKQSKLKPGRQCHISAGNSSGATAGQETRGRQQMTSLHPLPDVKSDCIINITSIEISFMKHAFTDLL